MTSLAFLFALTVAAQGPQVQRFGLFVGSNDGGPERIQLRYATTDAESVARFEQAIRQGPRGSRVDRFDVNDDVPGGHAGFSIR